MRVDPNDRLVVESTDEKPRRKKKAPRTPRPRRKGSGALGAVFVLIGLVVLLGAGALIAPSFIDWTQYKDVISAQVEKETGRRLQIDGGISLQLLPAPALAVEDVQLSNIDGASAPNMASLKALRVRVALSPLLQGEIQVESIVLIEPVIELERLVDGRVNWAFGAPSAGGEASTADGVSLPPLSLDSFTIEDGTIVYQDTAAGVVETIGGLNAEISAATLTGPFKAKGTLTARDMPLAIDLQTGEISGGGPVPVSLALQVPGSDAAARFNGTVDAANGGVRVDGKFDGSGQNFDRLLVALGGAEAPALAVPFAARGDLTAVGDDIAVSNLTIELGDDRGTGDVSLTLGDKIATQVALRLSKLDVDAVMASVGGDDGAQDDDAGLAGLPSMPANLAGVFDISIDALTYNGSQLRDAKLIATLDDGALMIANLSAAGPGDSKVRLAGRVNTAADKPEFKGRLQASATNLRGVAEMFDVSMDAVPANRLRTISLKTDIAGDPQTINLSDLDLRLDASTISGGATIALGPRPGLGVSLNVDKINVDDYLATGPRPDAENAPNGGEGGALGAFDANLMLNVDTLIYNKTSIRGLALEATLIEGDITINKVGATNVAGAKVAFDGNIVGLPDAPAAKGRFSLEAQSLDGVVRLAAIELPVAPKDLGPTVAGGDIDYTAERVILDAEVSTAGGTWEVAGTMADPVGSPTFDLEVDLSHPDLDRLAAVAAVDLPEVVEGLGAVALKGTVKGDAHDVDIDVGMAAAGGTVKVDGTVANMATTPSYDLAIDGDFPDAALPLRLADIDAGGNIAALGRFGLTGTVKSADDAVDVDLAIELGSGGLSTAGRLSGLPDAPRYVGDLSATHPDLRALIAAMSPGFDTSVEPLGTLGLSLKTEADAAAVKLDDLEGNLGPVDFDGAMEIVLSEPRPRINGSLATGTIPLDLFAAGQSASADEPRWSREPFDFSGLDAIDGELALTPEAVTFGPYRVDAPRLLVTIKSGTLSIPEFNGGLFGGRMTLVGRLAQKSPIETAVNVNVRDANVARALEAQGQALLTRGVLDLDLNLSGAGISEFDLVSALNGTARLNVRDGIVDGFDLARVDGQLANLESGQDLVSALKSTAGLVGLVSSAFVGGETSFSKLSGNFAVRNGVVTSDDISLIANGGIGVASLTADLPRWVMNLNSRFNFASLPDIPVGVSMSGPIDAPENAYETAALQRYLLERAGPSVGGLLQNIPGAGTVETGVGSVIQGLPGTGSAETGVGGLIEPLPGAATGGAAATGIGGVLQGLPQGIVPEAILPPPPPEVAPAPVPAPQRAVTTQPTVEPAPDEAPLAPGAPQPVTIITTVPVPPPAPAPVEPAVAVPVEPAPAQPVPAPASSQPAPRQDGAFGSIVDSILRPRPQPVPQVDVPRNAPPGDTATPGPDFSIEGILKGLGQ